MIARYHIFKNCSERESDMAMIRRSSGGQETRHPFEPTGFSERLRGILVRREREFPPETRPDIADLAGRMVPRIGEERVLDTVSTATHAEFVEQAGEVLVDIPEVDPSGVQLARQLHVDRLRTRLHLLIAELPQYNGEEKIDARRIAQSALEKNTLPENRQVVIEFLRRAADLPQLIEWIGRIDVRSKALPLLDGTGTARDSACWSEHETGRLFPALGIEDGRDVRDLREQKQRIRERAMDRLYRLDTGRGTNGTVVGISEEACLIAKRLGLMDPPKTVMQLALEYRVVPEQMRAQLDRAVDFAYHLAQGNSLKA